MHPIHYAEITQKGGSFAHYYLHHHPLVAYIFQNIESTNQTPLPWLLQKDKVKVSNMQKEHQLLVASILI